ncbi:hypothetical protein EVG20_g3135 [Dentipellis fragilis]|uniref:Uncharacterized protein n=1 Tax=Dentipellis fragilis TaxID=205917 RepID=A0A4Y9Z4A8_9AGAM|nr:hypothetical protein EVG20_g3135 [Dentipellis fragilis]
MQCPDSVTVLTASSSPFVPDFSSALRQLQLTQAEIDRALGGLLRPAVHVRPRPLSAPSLRGAPSGSDSVCSHPFILRSALPGAGTIGREPVLSQILPSFFSSSLLRWRVAGGQSSQMSQPIWITERQTVSLFCESLLHGIFTILTCLAIYMLWRKEEKSRFERMIIPATLLMYAISTTHISMRFTALLLAIRGETIQSPAGAWIVSKGFEGIRIYLPAINVRFSPTSTHKCQLIPERTSQVVVGDTVVIWRVWAIWNRNRAVCIIPLIFLFGAVVAGITGTTLFYTTPDDIRAERVAMICELVFFSFCASTNIVATVLIAIRAWKHRRLLRLSMHNGKLSEATAHLRRPFALTIESGALYSSTWIILLSIMPHSVEVKGADSVLLDMLVQLTGIYPTMIVVVVCLKQSLNDTVNSIDLTSIHLNSLSELPQHSTCTSDTALGGGGGLY